MQYKNNAVKKTGYKKIATKFNTIQNTDGSN